MIAFDIVGDPTSQGSHRPYIASNGKARLVEQTGAKHRVWRAVVADAAREVARTLPGPLDGALTIDVTFRFAMPASRSKKVKALGVAPKTTSPDGDKLDRALFDGLKVGGLIRDDARLWDWHGRKVEVWGGWTGAQVRIEAE